MTKIGVIGAGSWGSALAVSFATNNQVLLYVRDSKQYQVMVQSNSNPNYLPSDVSWGDNLSCINDFGELESAQVLILAMPINAMRSVLQQIKSHFVTIPHIIWVCKGFESSSGLLPHQIINQELPGFDNYSALLGPSFAAEVARLQPTAICLVGNSNVTYLEKLRELINPERNFRIYVNDDMVGSEVGAAVKNVLAIMVGVSDGLSLGYNARSALITRSLNELSSLVRALGGKTHTIYGLTGIGDLILTCTGELSRNRKIGLELAKGKKLDQIVSELGHVAEGVKTTVVVRNLGQQYGLDLPIINAVYAILYESIDPQLVLIQLMERSFKVEFE